MNWIDWCMLAIPVVGVILIGCMTQKFQSSVSGFLSAGRCAGRYLLAVADGSAAMGLISLIAMFEMYYKSGFAIGFWNQFSVVVMLILALSGFVAYRFRETRALTMAEFFEKRYNRKVRIYAGGMAFFSGVLNYALFPAIGGRFLMYYCGLPDYFSLGGVTVSTFGFLMAVSLAGALIIVLLGGQVTTMVTDCVQGIISYFIYAVVIAVIFYTFSIADFQEAAMLRPEGESYFNPFNIDKLTTFNLLFFIIALFSAVYTRNAWLGSQAYMTAASSPHEQKMAGLLGTWRNGFIGIMVTLIILGVFAYMNHPNFAVQGAAVTTELAERINFDSAAQTATLRNQMLVPVALRHILPHGAIGLFCALAVFLMVSTDTTYLHSWGSILAQDVILPLRGDKPISPKAQLFLIRCCIFGVAIFAWIFSFYFGQIDYILMFQAATGTIWLGGAGALVVGGLYSRKGTSAGAITALTLSLIFGFGGFLLNKYWESGIYPWWAENFPASLESFRLTLRQLGDALPIVNWDTDPESMKLRFPITSQEIYGLTMLICIAGYVIASLLTPNRKDFNLEKLLHRGEYAVASDQVTGDATAAKPSWVQRIVGITPDYSKWDKVLAWSVLGYTVLILHTSFIIPFLCNVLGGAWGELGWFKWFKYVELPLNLLYGFVTTIWFTWGGGRDLFRLFKNLKNISNASADDNGMVKHE